MSIGVLDCRVSCWRTRAPVHARQARGGKGSGDPIALNVGPPSDLLRCVVRWATPTEERGEDLNQAGTVTATYQRGIGPKTGAFGSRIVCRTRS